MLDQNLNKLSTKNKFPQPRIDDLFDQLQGIMVFWKIDLNLSRCQLKIKRENVPIAAFNTRYGHYEFGLTNTPMAFMDLINRGFKPYLNKIVIVFTDDTIVYSKSKAEHEQYLKKVLQKLREEKLYAKFFKREFLLEKVNFLGHM